MHLLLRIGLLAAGLLLIARPSSAQETDAQAAAAAYLKPHLQTRVVLADTLARFRTEMSPAGRLDVEERILRAEYNIKERVQARLAPEAAARVYLSETAAKFGIADVQDELVVTKVTRGKSSSHVALQQVFRGVPVYNRNVKVNLDADGQPTMVMNGFAPHVSRDTRLRTTPSIAKNDAASRAAAAGRGDLVTTAPELVVYPSKPARLAWLLMAWPESGTVEWEVLVDAHTGEIIQMLDLSPHAQRPAASGKHEARHPQRPASSGEHEAPSAPRPSSSAAHEAPQASPGTNGAVQPSAFPPASASPEAIAAIEGTGMVFDPDPITTAGVAYGPPYVDANDSDIPELNAERRQVALRDISQGSDGLYRLSGPYVIIDNGTRGDPYEPPVEASPDGFQYTRANDYFEAVMAYYHVDKSQRYVQSLDVGFDIKNEPVLVNPQAYPSDDSEFRSGNNIMLFGVGGIDDAEDADVIWHEYAHTLLHFTAPDLLRTFDGQALHEGWADYWAASYSRFLSEEDPTIPAHDWERVFTWDGNLPCWPGRPLDHPGSYPDDTEYPTSGCVGYGTKYQYGMLWGTTLMDIYGDLGRTVVDRLNLASHIYLTSSSTFPDAAQAIIQADEDLYSGVHANVLIEHFGARGYVDPAAYGPILTHTPLGATEQLEGEVFVEVTAVGTTAAVDSVLIYYGSDASTSNRVVLEAAGGDVYNGALPLPSEPGDVYYYVEAVDVEGRHRRLPSGAPLETYVFQVGPDAVAPMIAHNAPLNVSVLGWPMDLYAVVQDNVGVDSVWVEYAIQGAGGNTVVEGTFGLADTLGAHTGRFPATGHKVQEGESVSYRIFARDVSRAGNIAVSPADGYYHVSIVERGVLRAYDFEGVGHGLQADGIWQRGSPEYGLRVAHSGQHVWATHTAAAYPESPQTSSLQLPSVDLSEAGTTHLVFWHWYDFEHDGGAEPGVFNPNAGIWDGGNVKVSTDGGASWEILEPEGGYNGTISDQYQNPIGGEPGFGGYSYGWRREIVQLPVGTDVRVRFDFGTDGSNRDRALYFAGWHVDDVSITVTYPEDDAAPIAETLPPSRTILVPGQDGTPDLSVTVTDATGVEAVIAQYRVITDGGEESGSIRLAMAPTDRSVYTGSVLPPRSFAPGDRVEYRLIVRDFNGNEVVYPSPNESYIVDFRASQQSSALTRTVATGAWRRQGSVWVTTGPSPDEQVSSLVLEPFTPPANGESFTFVLEHRYELDGQRGGNVKISADDGKTWMLLEPRGGYPTVLSAGSSHRMEGEGVFAGSSSGTATDAFDLSIYAGRNIRLRLDFASPDPVDPGAGWFVQSASYKALSADDEFETPYELHLHANFPDPFRDLTTIAYSVPERTPVRISVYDLLGRRVALVRHVEQDAGIYTVQFDGSGLANGVYMLYLETTMGTRTERIVVAR